MRELRDYSLENVQINQLVLKVDKKKTLEESHKTLNCILFLEFNEREIQNANIAIRYATANKSTLTRA